MRPEASTMSDVLAVVCVAVWIYLICGRGRFWLARVRDTGTPPPADNWPSVVAVIPARNEAETVAASVQSLLRQDYRGSLTVIVADDDSDDGTAAVATVAAVNASTGRTLTIVTSSGPPAGWTGKLWAVRQGIAAAEISRPDYLLLSDADIVHAPDIVSWLVSHSISGRFALTSLMAKLRCESLAERSHVPAFVYFFQMLFPFSQVCDPRSTTAAAAGGCMLVRADALRSAGGIDSIRNALIDDCALATKLKAVGPIWLGLTNRSVSVRPYASMADVRHMISRSAYTQLRYSLWRLAGTIAGMALVFVAPPLLAIFASGFAQYLGLAAWLAMAVSFQPMLRFYRLSPLWGL